MTPNVESLLERAQWIAAEAAQAESVIALSAAIELLIQAIREVAKGDNS